MEITPDSMALAILAFPGFTASYVYRKLRGAKPKTDWGMLFESIFFSITSYTVWFLCSGMLAMRFPHVIDFNGSLVLNALINNKPTAIITASAAILIIGTTITGVIFAALAAYLHSHNLLNKWGAACKLTKRIGDEDVWETFLEQLDPPCPVIRDARTKRTYYGTITNYSDTNEVREIALENVRVFNEDGTLLYRLARIYISREPSDLTLEYKPEPDPAIMDTETKGLERPDIGDENA